MLILSVSVMVTIAVIACYARSRLVCKALPGRPGPSPQWCRAARSHGAEAVTPVVTSEAVSCTGACAGNGAFK